MQWAAVRIQDGDSILPPQEWEHIPIIQYSKDTMVGNCPLAALLPPMIRLSGKLGAPITLKSY